MKRRILSAVLILCVLATVLSTSVLAANTNITNVEITFSKHTVGDVVSEVVASVNLAGDSKEDASASLFFLDTSWYYYKGGYDAFLTQSGEWISITDTDHTFQNGGLYRCFIHMFAKEGYIFPYDTSKSTGGYLGTVTVGNIDMTSNTKQQSGFSNTLSINYIELMQATDDTAAEPDAKEETAKLVGQIYLTMAEPKIGDALSDFGFSCEAFHSKAMHSFKKFDGSYEDYMSNSGSWSILTPDDVLEAGIYNHSVIIFMADEYVNQGMQYPVEYEKYIDNWVNINGRDYSDFTSRLKPGSTMTISGKTYESRTDICNAITIDFIFMLDDSGFHALMELPKTVIENPFSDVPENAYYHDAVLWALENGVTTGTSDTTFSPKATCTRGQVVTFLWRAMGCPEPTSTKNPFKDVSADAYYYKAVLWAVEKGITTGTSDTTFSPDNLCTSAQVVTFLWRSNGCPVAEGTSKLASANAGQYYTDAVAWADVTGLLTIDGVQFVANDNSPRANIVTYLYRNSLNS